MENIEKIVKKILENVKKNGDQALLYYSKKFDNVILEKKELIIDVKKFENSITKIPSQILKAFQIAKKNIEYYHKKQFEKSLKNTLKISKNELLISEKISNINKIGIYVPGGRYSYPSTIFMTVCPAKCAGSNEIIIATPKKKLTDIVKAAIFMSGATKVLCVGGAQAIAALAFGTESVKKVDMIAGPGNAFVTEAKRQVFGKVGIDMLAGPSDILIFADETLDLNFIATDLQAQAEHDLLSKAVLIVESKNKLILKKVRQKISTKFLKQIEFYDKKTLDEIIDFINDFAPEHLEICSENRDKIDIILKNIKNVGAIFIGQYTCVAMGDYFIGPSHTLPTASSAKFSSGLSVNTFLKKTAVMEVGKTWIMKNAEYIKSIAAAEGLEFHKKSIDIRKK
ncbi:MAG: histidinol dehydrogenase [Elusimicrobiota bacterium]|jgi:histidinol dehydrogenase|nr:histidinol dehydrogenase [Elusimicrobiota bacterium]